MMINADALANGARDLTPEEARVFERRMSDETKAQRIFTVLADGERLGRDEIMRRTGLSLPQFRGGWYHLRRSLGSLAVVENHGEASTYHLSSDYSDGAADRYRYWQDRNIYTRLWSLLRTLEQMEEVARRTDAADGESIHVAQAGVRDAIAAMKSEVRRAAMRSGADAEETERIMAASESRGH